MKTMREKFEELEKINDILEEYKSDIIIFNDEKHEYEAKLYSTFVPEYIEWLNGAWYAFQEQQKKIDAIVQLVNLRKAEGNYYDDYIVDKIEELLNESQPK